MSRWRDLLRVKLADSPHVVPRRAANIARIDKTHAGEGLRNRNTAARPEQFVNSGNIGTAAEHERVPLDPITLRDDYEERAAIVEFDARRPRLEAEVEAYRAAVARWMLHNPPTAIGTPECCAHCAQGPRLGQVILPFSAAIAANWLHDRCWPEWRAKRQREAESALASLGLSRLKTRESG